MKISDFDYELPEDQIASHPLADRDASRLLVLDRGTGSINHRHFRDLSEYLRAGDALVINETRVRPARIQGARATGGKVDFLLLSEHPDGGWEALVRPGKRVRAGESVTFPHGRVEILDTLPGGRRRVRLASEQGDTLNLDDVGLPALPPYIRRPPDADDRERYQTVYARVDGAVAAPTAGLHFTPSLLDELGGRGVRVVPIVLHVGYGTFKPVREEDPSRHTMEEERFDYPLEAARTLEEVRRDGGRVIAVGTTCVRVLETVGRSDEPVSGGTSLFIRPPYEFKAVDALVTNFHLPRSTLLMLVCAFAGRDRMLGAYEEARDAGYRFFSYGDAMLIL